MTFAQMAGYESPEQEVARLSAAPDGSINKMLSALPVTITEYPQDLVIELPSKFPWRARHRVVVVPISYRGDAREYTPKHLHAGWWECAVVFSDYDMHPAQGHRLSIPAAELARGRKLNLESL